MTRPSQQYRMDIAAEREAFDWDAWNSKFAEGLAALIKGAEQAGPGEQRELLEAEMRQCARQSGCSGSLLPA